MPILGLAGLAGCDLPKDPADSTQRIVAEHEIRVGVSENPPWVTFVGGEPRGIEPFLVRHFAHGMGAQVRWVRSGEGPLLTALERRELDLVVGGLTSASPWRSRLGMSRSYLVATKRVATPARLAAPPRLAARVVGIAPGDPDAATLRRDGAYPVSPNAAPMLRVLYDWQIGPGLRATRFTLASERHVIAAAPGENRLLLRLDRFLQDAEPDLPTILAREAGR